VRFRQGTAINFSLMITPLHWVPAAPLNDLLVTSASSCHLLIQEPAFGHVFSVHISVFLTNWMPWHDVESWRAISSSWTFWCMPRGAGAGSIREDGLRVLRENTIAKCRPKCRLHTAYPLQHQTSSWCNCLERWTQLSQRHTYCIISHIAALIDRARLYEFSLKPQKSYLPVLESQ